MFLNLSMCQFLQSESNNFTYGEVFLVGLMINEHNLQNSSYEIENG